MNDNSPRKSGRGALTLLELLVVLTILIALGGIVIASLPGLLERTQSATAAANVPEIDAALKRNLLIRNGLLGNRFDALVTGSISINGDVASYIGGSETFESVPLNDADVNALAELGITELVPAAEDASDATFQSHAGAAIPISAQTKVCAISSAFSGQLIHDLWNIQSTEGSRFVVFGLGQRCSLVGAGPDALFSDAPIHFSDNSLSSPKNMYSRYLIVVELKSSEQTVKARYIGTAIPHQTGLQGVQDELKEFYSRQS